MVLSVALALASFPSFVPQAEGPIGSGGFEVLERIDIGAAPHQIAFDTDGARAWIAVSGANAVIELETYTRRVVRRWPLPGTPIGVAPADAGGAPLVSLFGRSSVERLSWSEQIGERVEVGGAPSFLVPIPSAPYPPSPVAGDFLVSSETSNTLTVLSAEPLALEATFETGERPFPAAVTSDGRLAFVPNYIGGSLTPVDLWNRRVYDDIEVGSNPSGGVALPGDRDCLVAVRGEDRLAIVNTAARRITGWIEEGIGDSPFSVVLAPNGRLAFINNSGSADVSVLDVERLEVIARVPVGEIPIAMGVLPRGDQLWVSCEGSHELVVVSIPKAWRASKPRPQGAAARVAVLGMTHGLHLGSEQWGLDEVRTAIRNFAPDAVLTEIPPDRWQRISEDWVERGAIEDERLQRFPEYTDVLLPLASELGFEIVPCAAWTQEMSDLRSARTAEFESEARFAESYAEYQRAVAELDGDELPGAEHDPELIHSSVYDEWTRRRLAPYDEYLSEWIGPGGWTKINRAHMSLIDAAIDARPGQRLLVTFGAGHKYWILDRLRERADVRVLDARAYLPSPSMNPPVDAAAQREVVELHRFFQDWFAGTLANDDAVFARFADVMDPSFEIIGTDGKRTGREALVARLRAAYGFAGATGSGPMRIWTRAERSRAAGEGLLLVTYEEWQETSEGVRGRQSTGLLRRAQGTPNGFVWLHVHETWLPEE